MPISPTPTERPLPPSPTITRLVYHSEADLPAGMALQLVREIHKVAQVRNAEVGITGALAFTDFAFLQVLEGEERAVAEVFERIARDDRHRAVRVLQVEGVRQRLFGSWTMRLVPSARLKEMAGARFDPYRLDARMALRLLGREERQG